MHLLRRTSVALFAGYSLVFAVLWVVFRADLRGQCSTDCSSLFRNDFFVSTVPFLAALSVLAVVDVGSPTRRLGRWSALIFALAAIGLGLFAAGVVGDILQSLRGSDRPIPVLGSR